MPDQLSETPSQRLTRLRAAQALAIAPGDPVPAWPASPAVRAAAVGACRAALDLVGGSQGGHFKQAHFQGTRAAGVEGGGRSGRRGKVAAGREVASMR